MLGQEIKGKRGMGGGRRSATRKNGKGGGWCGVREQGGAVDCQVAERHHGCGVSVSRPAGWLAGRLAGGRIGGRAGRH